MEKVQQQLSERDTYTPTVVFQDCSPVAMSLNREETLSEHGSETSDNSLDGNLHRQTGGLNAKVSVLSIANQGQGLSFGAMSSIPPTFEKVGILEVV